MGLFEDDRIRSKNSVHNIAYETYSSFKDSGMTDADILQRISDRPFVRNEINEAIEKLAGGSRAKATK